MRTILLLFIFFGLYLSANAHSHLKGQILDAETQIPLQGVSISLKNSTNGTFSDQNGFFELYSDSVINTLVFGYIGFQTMEIEVNNPSEQLLVELQPVAFEMGQIVIQQKETNNLNTLTETDLQLRPVRSAQEVLQKVPGLFIAQHAGGGKAEQIFLRGFDIDHGTDIAINVDGIPVNMVSHAHGQGYADLHFLIPELIEEIDFGKGPYYSQQGNFSTAGYVGLNTWDRLPQSQIKVEAGRFNSLRALAMVDLLGKANRQEGHNAYVAADLQFTDGPFESKQHFYRLNLAGKYTGLLNENNLLKVQASTFRSRWDASGQIPERAVDSIGRFGAIDDTEGGKTHRTNTQLQIRSGLASGDVIRNRFYYTNYGFELYSNFTFFANDSLNGDQIRQREQRHIFGYASEYDWATSAGQWDFTTQFGTGFRYDHLRGNELSHTRNRRETLERRAFGNVDEFNLHLWADERIQFGKLLINAGLRLDYFRFSYVDHLATNYQTQSQSKLFISPKLNFLLNLTPDVQLYLKTGRSFHSNDSRVVVAQQGQKVLPAAWGADLGGIFKPVDRLLINTAVWYLFLEQEFVYVGDEGIVEPSGRTQRLGLDFSARLGITNWLFFDTDLNWAFARSIDEDQGNRYIPLAPILTSIGGFSMKHKTGINGSLRYRYIMNRPANEDNSLQAKGYFLLDANLNYTHRKFELGIGIENLLNSDWNEAQFETASQLRSETTPVTELHFTPGTPFFIKGHVAYFF